MPLKPAPSRIKKTEDLIGPDWEALAARYCTPDFIANDPVSFPHAYRHLDDWRNAECAGLIAAMFSYGRRDLILATVEGILRQLGPEPVEALANLSERDLKKRFRGFYYRFNTATDLVFLLGRLGEIYREGGSLKALWNSEVGTAPDLKNRIHRFRQAFLHGSGHYPLPDTNGMRFLFADPLQNSAAKRFNMFLRWMSRSGCCVDLGLWSDTLPAADLVFPLDTHVATMARKYGITRRKSNDWKTVEEITGYFRRLDASDPVRFDFALFGLGLAERNGLSRQNQSE